MIRLSLVLAMVALLVALAACSGSKTTPVPVAVAPTSTFVPTATASPTETPTSTPQPTATATATPTKTPTSIPPTATPLPEVPAIIPTRVAARSPTDDLPRTSRGTSRPTAAPIAPVRHCQVTDWSSDFGAAINNWDDVTNVLSIYLALGTERAASPDMLDLLKKTQDSWTSNKKSSACAGLKAIFGEARKAAVSARLADNNIMFSFYSEVGVVASILGACHCR